MNDVLRGLISVEALEAELCDDQELARLAESRSDQVEGGRLIRLGETTVKAEDTGTWVDRYDARLLLSPPHSTSFQLPRIVTPPPISPTGYSDLPSDHEEMFYFEPEERDQIAQKKQRRKRDDEASRRIKMREEEDRQHEEEIRLSKIPPAEQISLMSRTLAALRASPAPSMLEIRILTNHGNDSRFSSFLRRDGKWREYWDNMKSGLIETDSIPFAPQSSPQLVASTPKTLMGLADYGESSEEDADDDRADGRSDSDETDRPGNEPDHSVSSKPIEPSSKSSLDNQPPDLLPRGSDHSPDTNPSSCDNTTQQRNNETLDDILLSFQDEKTQKAVEPEEILKRQERARQWAKRRKIIATSQTSKESTQV
ncbi:hypothetical protein BY996DRAFT_8384594 [Phakopsora pachyrhizi]|uniref:SURP motif domain-containing protein n=1 Tax=Phakopsora pachyrhizi TaxID=170000 RepID=A0AAV0B1I8_PHAPC|nr:hypothetical protein BY996DRAFT_8384594 [Phakopsora pachyrhizi]CAH7675684.1 hypothetical protein PPACK8108_LOCUS10710 [Phakopsora pachyrhizi]